MAVSACNRVRGRPQNSCVTGMEQVTELKSVKVGKGFFDTTRESKILGCLVLAWHRGAAAKTAMAMQANGIEVVVFIFVILGETI